MLILFQSSGPKPTVFLVYLVILKILQKKHVLCFMFRFHVVIVNFLLIKNVLWIWMEKGVDGFRTDATPYLFENEKFLDEPLSG